MANDATKRACQRAKRPALQKKELLHKIFDQFDSQKTQNLSRDDLLGVLKGGSNEENTAIVEEMLEKFDMDHDGNLSYKEFEAVMLSES